MQTLKVLTLLLGSFAAGYQNSDLTQTPQAGDASPTVSASHTSTPRAQKLPPSSSKSKTEISAQGNKQVATKSNTPASTQRTCQMSAYIIDKDPKGLNVRSGPGSSYEIIGKLPTTPLAVFVELTASQGDWVQLSKARSPEKAEFQGTGWVYAQLLGTSTRGYGSKGVSVYASANTQSPVVGRIPEHKSVTLLGCDRAWALVEYEGLSGWIAPDAQCPNPLTTCP
jgi:uncharacterized protein YraI